MSTRDEPPTPIPPIDARTPPRRRILLPRRVALLLERAARRDERDAEFLTGGDGGDALRRRHPVRATIGGATTRRATRVTPPSRRRGGGCTTRERRGDGPRRGRPRDVRERARRRVRRCPRRASQPRPIYEGVGRRCPDARCEGGRNRPRAVNTPTGASGGRKAADDGDERNLTPEGGRMVRFLRSFGERTSGRREGGRGRTACRKTARRKTVRRGGLRFAFCSTPPPRDRRRRRLSARAGTTAARATDDSPSPRPPTRTRVSRTQTQRCVSSSGTAEDANALAGTRRNQTKPNRRKRGRRRRVPVRPSVERAHVQTPPRASRALGRARPRRVSARLSYPLAKGMRTFPSPGRAEAFAVCATRRTARGGARTDSPSRTRRRTSP